MTDTPEMVERVARAICATHCSPALTDEARACQVDNGWELWVAEAQAALAAMEEPTPEMVEAGAAAMLRVVWGPRRDASAPVVLLAATAYRAMIQAAFGKEEG